MSSPERRHGGSASGRRDGVWLRTRAAFLRVDSPPFDLYHTLLCGQTFRWRERAEGRGFLGVVSGRVLWLEQRGDHVLYRSLPGKFRPPELRRYLSLDGVHSKAIRSFPKDDLLCSAVKTFPGLRVLQQDPWETLISFIITANNSIRKTRNSIECLCRIFGREIKGVPGFHSFPPPEVLAYARLATLRKKCNLGYRDKYVKTTAREVAADPHLLSKIANLPYPHARKEIMSLPGVGPKVADCVLLYSMGQFEAFPIDTWIRKIIRKEYPHAKDFPLPRVGAFARDHFGPYAGYAQLYLFHYALMTGI